MAAPGGAQLPLSGCQKRETLRCSACEIFLSRPSDQAVVGFLNQCSATELSRHRWSREQESDLRFWWDLFACMAWSAGREMKAVRRADGACDLKGSASEW